MSNAARAPSAERQLSKLSMAELFGRADVPYPHVAMCGDTSSVERFAAQHGFPLVFKPERGSGAVDTFAVSSDAELQRRESGGARSGQSARADFRRLRVTLVGMRKCRSVVLGTRLLALAVAWPWAAAAQDAPPAEPPAGEPAPPSEPAPAPVPPSEPPPATPPAEPPPAPSPPTAPPPAPAPPSGSFPPPAPPVAEKKAAPRPVPPPSVPPPSAPALTDSGPAAAPPAEPAATRASEGLFEEKRPLPESRPHDEADEDEKTDHFKIGPVVGLGIPSVLSIGGTLKLTRFLGAGINVGLIPKVQLSYYGDATLSYQHYDIYGRLYPLGGGFFLQGGAGYATVDGTLSKTFNLSALGVSSAVAYESQGSVRTLMLTALIGYFYTTSIGFSFGIDAGAQIPIAPSQIEFSSTVQTGSIPPALVNMYKEQYVTPTDNSVRATLEKIGRTVLPTTNLRIGWIL